MYFDNCAPACPPQLTGGTQFAVSTATGVVRTGMALIL